MHNYYYLIYGVNFTKSKRINQNEAFNFLYSIKPADSFLMYERWK